MMLFARNISNFKVSLAEVRLPLTMCGWIKDTAELATIYCRRIFDACAGAIVSKKLYRGEVSESVPPRPHHLYAA